MSHIPPQIPDKGSADVFVLSCIDPRFSSYLTFFLEHQRNLQHYYDQFSLAGSSLGYLQAKVEPPPDLPVLQFLHWDQALLDHVQLGISLHNVTELWCFDHMDCGAYKAFTRDYPVDDDRNVHINNMIAFHDDIARISFTAFGGIGTRTLKVKCFLMDFDGSIELVAGASDSGGIAIEWENDTNVWKYATFGLLFSIFLLFISTNFYNSSSRK